MNAPERIWEFDRYINGVLMAEGVTITQAATLEQACVSAARLASRGRNGEVPILVLRADLYDAQAAEIADLRRQLAEAREVKPLEWQPHPFSQSTVEECAIADAPFSHRYQAQRDPWARTYMAFLYPRPTITDSTLWWESKGHADIEAAKAAAQTDYNSRILSALKGTP